MRILIGLTEIAGYYQHLKSGFQELGVEYSYIDLSGNPFYSKEQDANQFERLITWVGRKNASTHNSGILRKIFWKAIKTFLSLLIFLWALPRHDVFVFGYGISFFFLYDLPLLKFFNKKVIVVFHGTDSRPAYLGYPEKIKGKASIEAIIKHTRQQKRMVRKVEAHADVVICHSLSAHLLEKPFIQYISIGLPFPPQQYQQPQPDTTQASFGDAVRILHSPSNPKMKGTDRIRQAIQNLQRKGYNIDFIQISGKPNQVVLQELSRCDFVVDELYSDVRMAGFAVEAASFGKPAVVGGYAGPELERTIAPGGLAPSHFCHPDEIETAIEKLIIDPSYRLDLGQRARKFVEENWTARQVAQRYIRLIQGEIPPEWYYDPQDIRYLYGCGITVQQARSTIAEIIQKDGVQALQLSDKPELEQSYLDLIKN